MDGTLATGGDVAFWTRARRHMLQFGGAFVPFVPVRAEGSFVFDWPAGACLISLPGR